MASGFRFQVSPTSGVPIYRQIMDQVRHQAATGRLTAGEFLPSVREVARDLQINPMTVSKAYSLLERDGVVEFVRGQGMRLRTPEGGGADLREREEALMPLLRQVVTTAYQLSLKPEQVRALLDPLLEDLNRGDE